MTKTITAPKAAATFLMWPEDLVIIGLDTSHKCGEHPLWDERAFRPVKEPSVKNMMVNRGRLVSAIVAEQDAELGYVVADGRGRVLDAREANKRLKERGEEPFRLKVEIELGGDENASFERMVVKNAFTTPTTLLADARKAVDMLKGGVPMAKVCLSFGKSEDTIRLWQQVVELPPELRKRVDRGLIPPSQAVKLAKANKEQLEAALRVADGREAMADGKPKRQSARELAKAAGKVLPPTRKEVKALLDDDAVMQRAEKLGKGTLADAFLAGLRYGYAGGRLPAFIATEGDPLEAAILEHGLNDKGCAVYVVEEGVESIHGRLKAAGVEVSPAELSKTLKAMHKAGKVGQSVKGYRLAKGGS